VPTVGGSEIDILPDATLHGLDRSVSDEELRRNV